MRACLFGFFFLIYLLTSSAALESEVPKGYETAKSLAAGRHGKLSAPAEKTLRLAYTVVFVPAAGAATLLLVYLALGSLPAVVILGLATPFWHAVRTAQDETLVALGFAIWVYGMTRKDAVPAALGGALAFSTRGSAAAPLVPLAVATLCGARRNLVPGILFAGLALGAVVISNLERFGSPVGGLLGSFTSFSWSTLALFAYAPVLLCLGLARPRSGLAWAGLSGFAAAVVWNGEARLLVAPLILLAPWLVETLRTPSRLLRPALVALSVGIQLFSSLDRSAAGRWDALIHGELSWWPFRFAAELGVWSPCLALVLIAAAFTLLRRAVAGRLVLRVSNRVWQF